MARLRYPLKDWETELLVWFARTAAGHKISKTFISQAILPIKDATDLEDLKGYAGPIVSRLMAKSKKLLGPPDPGTALVWYLKDAALKWSEIKKLDDRISGKTHSYPADELPF